jgi:hypothetical protein
MKEEPMTTRPAVTEEPATAVLFIYHSDGQVNHDVFTHSDDCSPDRDPWHRADALWRSVESDFPGAIHAIAINEPARMMMSKTRMRAMGFDTGLESLDV